MEELKKLAGNLLSSWCEGLYRHQIRGTGDARVPRRHDHLRTATCLSEYVCRLGAGPRVGLHRAPAEGDLAGAAGHHSSQVHRADGCLRRGRHFRRFGCHLLHDHLCHPVSPYIEKDARAGLAGGEYHLDDFGVVLFPGCDLVSFEEKVVDPVLDASQCVTVFFAPVSVPVS